ncbi:hypothetical protein AERO9AM_10299 [Aeromicrobium sp. 9AM]|nr:hypothetical protein AERO9AM_10299 [Aeromicrobium sp. 9AM]
MGADDSSNRQRERVLVSQKTVGVMWRHDRTIRPIWTRFEGFTAPTTDPTIWTLVSLGALPNCVV